MGSHESLRACLDRHAVCRPAVSAWSVGQHLAHSFIVTAGIVAQLATSPRGERREAFSVVKLLVLSLGRMPRGRAQAPAATLPADEPSRAELTAACDQAAAALARLPGLEADRWFLHPVFGVIQTRSTVRFIDVHQRHHLAIIRDILA